MTRGLVVLDRRYKNVPGWHPVRESTRLERAAEQVSLLINGESVDLSVDARGWRPTGGIIEGPVLPGVAGAIQAQHNMLVDLDHVPHALNLRRVLHSQAQVSREAARHAAIAAPQLVDKFNGRADLYRNLVRASRDVGGLIGGGASAVTQSQNAESRLRHTSAIGVTVAGESLQEFARLCDRTDARIKALVEHGLSEKLYFVAINSPGLMEEPIRGIHRLQQRWLPAKSPDQIPLLSLIREQVRPQAIRVSSPAQSLESRTAYQAALTRQTTPAGPTGPLR